MISKLSNIQNIIAIPNCSDTIVFLTGNSAIQQIVPLTEKISALSPEAKGRACSYRRANRTI